MNLNNHDCRQRIKRGSDYMDGYSAGVSLKQFIRDDIRFASMGQKPGCAYCGTELKSNRCDSCGAPKRA